MRCFEFAVKNGVKSIFVIAMAIGVAGFLIYGPFGAAASGDDLEYGVLYSCPDMSNYAFKVLSCDKGWCQVFIVNAASPNGGNVTGQGKSSILELIRKNSCRVEGKAPAAPGDAGAPPKNVQTPPAGTTGSCAGDAILNSTPKANESMELRSKRAILARFQQAVDKGEKVAVAITFDNFLVGAPRANIRGVNYYEDAPVGAKIYSVKSKFTLCSTFSTEITRDEIDGRYDCFADKFGEWACGTATGYKIIKSTYEKIKR